MLNQTNSERTRKTVKHRVYLLDISVDLTYILMTSIRQWQNLFLITKYYVPSHVESFLAYQLKNVTSQFLNKLSDKLLRNYMPPQFCFFFKLKTYLTTSSSHVYNSDSGVFGVRVDVEVYERLVVISE